MWFVAGDYRLSDEQLEVESKKRKQFPTALEQGPVPDNMSIATAKCHVYMRNLFFSVFSVLVLQQLCFEAFPLTASDPVDK